MSCLSWATGLPGHSRDGGGKARVQEDVHIVLVEGVVPLLSDVWATCRQNLTPFECMLLMLGRLLSSLRVGFQVCAALLMSSASSQDCRTGDVLTQQHWAGKQAIGRSILLAKRENIDGSYSWQAARLVHRCTAATPAANLLTCLQVVHPVGVASEAGVIGGEQLGGVEELQVGAVHSIVHLRD